MAGKHKSNGVSPVSTSSPIDPFLADQGLLLLDGGLATELENKGYVLDTPLWSAHLLSTRPEAIREVHRAYLEAGANCIIAASYQASIPGFLAGGWTEDEATSLLRTAVILAQEARETYLDSRPLPLRPLVAASIGPYGAYLANGAEYRGDYGLSKQALREFHEPRWEILTSASPDLLACETIPNFQEAEVLLDLLSQTPHQFAWVSFSCHDGEHISDGTPIRDCAALLDDCEQVVAVGVNCTAPRYISSLVEQLHAAMSNTEVVVYPNSGEVYNAGTKTWQGTSEPLSCGPIAREWHARGARLIGGCCRMGPAHIEAIGAAF